MLWRTKEKRTQCVSALILLWNFKKCELSTLPKNHFNPTLKSRECQHIKGRYLKACMEVVMFVPHFTSVSYILNLFLETEEKSHLFPLLYCILHVLYFTAFYKRWCLCCSGNLGLHQNEINWSQLEHNGGVSCLSSCCGVLGGFLVQLLSMVNR